MSLCLQVRKKLDPEFKSQNPPQNVFAMSAAYATYMASSSNLRYQVRPACETQFKPAQPPPGMTSGHSDNPCVAAGSVGGSKSVHTTGPRIHKASVRADLGGRRRGTRDRAHAARQRSGVRRRLLRRPDGQHVPRCVHLAHSVCPRATREDSAQPCAGSTTDYFPARHTFIAMLHLMLVQLLCASQGASCGWTSCASLGCRRRPRRQRSETAQ